MFRASRRTFATLAVLGAILLVSPGAVAAADPAASTTAHAGGAQTGMTQLLGAGSQQGGTRVKPSVLDFHGSGLGPPATDTTSIGSGTGDVSGISPLLAGWMLLLLLSVVGSVRLLGRRLRE